MKNQVTFILPIFIFSAITYSQENDIYKNHLGINALSLKYIGKDNDYLFFKNKLCVLNGILFKKDYKHFSSRYSLSYNRFKTEVVWIGPDSYSGFHYHSIWSISTGIQKNHRSNKMILFYGLDLCNNLIIHKTDLSGGYAGEGIHDKDYDDWLGIGPLIGFQYHVTERLSLSIESSYILMTIVLSTEYDDETERFQHYFNPINAFAVYYSF
jgi:hypothetical protein